MFAIKRKVNSLVGFKEQKQQKDLKKKSMYGYTNVLKYVTKYILCTKIRFFFVLKK